MYLKNASTNTMVTIRTRMGKLSLKPGEVIDLKEKLYSPVSPNLKEATEEEYKSFLAGGKQPEEQIKEMDNEVSGATDEEIEQTITDSQNKIEAINAVKEELQSVEEITPETISNTINKLAKDIKDTGTLDFITKLFQANMMADKDVVIDQQEETIEEKSEESIEEKDALKVQTTTENTQRKLIEEQIAGLKETWTKAKLPKKKEKIAKQIKELQKQLDKI